MPNKNSQKQIRRIPNVVYAIDFLYRVGDRETFGSRGVLDALDVLLIPSKRWFDGMSLQSFATLRDVIHVLSPSFSSI